MGSGCARGGSGRVLEKASSPKEQLGARTGCPGRCLINVWMLY